uniref:Uncharacterized protein n=1 Tax=viral metagenome TaxID=1070528 RepID=A0A6C0KZ27_9ZZZZ
MQLYLYYSLFLGIFIKLYDDFVDLKLNINTYLIFIIKICIFLLTFLCIFNDSILGIIVMLSLLVSNFCKKFDDNFWYYYLYFIIFLCILLYKKIIIYNFDLIKIIFILFIPVSIYFEEFGFPEESSEFKYESRAYSIIMNSLLLIILETFNLIEKYELNFFVNLLIFVNSYFLTSIIINKLINHYPSLHNTTIS